MGRQNPRETATVKNTVFPIRTPPPSSQLSWLYPRLNPRTCNWEVEPNSSVQFPQGIKILAFTTRYFPIMNTEALIAIALLHETVILYQQSKPRGFWPLIKCLAPRVWVSLTEKFVIVPIPSSRPLVRAGVGEKKQARKCIVCKPFQRHWLHMQQSLGNLKPN